MTDRTIVVGEARTFAEARTFDEDYAELERRIAQQDAQITQQGLTIKRLLEEIRFNGL